MSSVSGPKNGKGALWVTKSWEKSHFPVVGNHIVLGVVMTAEDEQVPTTQGGEVFCFVLCCFVF